MNKNEVSKILDAVHETAKDMAKAGVMAETTLREFDALCLPKIKQYSPGDIRNIRLSQRVSQPVFAAHLNVSKSTVAQWEQGGKKPRGASLKLLDLIERKGLSALT